MSLTYAIKSKEKGTNAIHSVVDVTIGAAGDYSSGLTLDAKSCGVGRIDGIVVLGSNVGVIWQFDPVALKIRAYLTGASASAVLTEAAGSNVSAKVVRIEVTEYQNTFSTPGF